MGRLAGLALLGSIVESGGPTGPLCGKPVNFSSYDFPMADVTGSNDLILLQSEADGDDLLLPNNTLFIQIPGGNHAQFGSYDDSEREALLGQMDGEPFIAPYVQWDLSASAIYYVASRSGLELPPLPNSTCETGNDTSDAYRSSTCNIHTWIITMVVLLFYRKVF